MKKIVLLLSVVCFIGCTPCLLSQVPPQTIMAGPGCQAPLPDYRTKVIATDNCNGQVTVFQSPAPGTVLSVANPALTVVMTARDQFGNLSKPLNISVTLIDTIAPILSWPQGQANMTEKDVINLYVNWKEAVKVHGIAKWMYDMKWTQGLPLADTARIMESLHYFTNTIKLTDEEYNQYVSYVNSQK